MTTMTTDADAVCGMKVAAADNAMEYKGNTYAFCSPHCEKKFADEPDKYLAAMAQGETKSAGCCG